MLMKLASTTLVVILAITALSVVLGQASVLPSSATPILTPTAMSPAAVAHVQSSDASRLESTSHLCECIARVTVHVTDNGTAAGTPVPGVVVQLRTATGAPMATGVTDSNGVAAMEHVLVRGTAGYELWLRQTPDSDWHMAGTIGDLPCQGSIHVIVSLPPEGDITPTVTPTLALTVMPTATIPQAPTPRPAPTSTAPNLELISQIGSSVYNVEGVYVTDGPSTALRHGSEPALSLPKQGSGQSYAYVVGFCGLAVIDVSDPSSPVVAGRYDAFDLVYDVHVAGHYAYIVAGVAGLRVIDVSDPTAPREVGFNDTLSFAYDVYVAGQYAYVADGDYMRVVDISDPTAPAVVGAYTPRREVWVQDVFVADDYAYLAAGNAGLQVVDISDPAVPTRVGFFRTPKPAKDVYVAGSYAYIIVGNEGLQVLDVSDPTAPTEVSYHAAEYICDFYYFDITTATCDVYVAGHYAYVAAEDAGLHIVDVSDPTAPVEVAAYDTAYQSSGVYAAGNYVYLAAGTQGLLILRFASTLAYTPTTTLTATLTATVTLTPTFTPTPTPTPTATATPEDTQPPRIVAFDFEPKVVSLARKSRLEGYPYDCPVMTLTVRITDETGVAEDLVPIHFVWPGWEPTGDWMPALRLETTERGRIAGDARDGVYVAWECVPDNEPLGTWTFGDFFLFDVTGGSRWQNANGRWYTPQDLAELGFPTTYIVTDREPVFLPMVLRDFP
ncbi:MAG: hypothetical protein ACE5LU_10420 [Anaerolineae bacterium]